jgi:hypothetical protein
MASNYSNFVGEIKDFSTKKRLVISADTNNITRFSLNTKYCGSPIMIRSLKIPFDLK